MPAVRFCCPAYAGAKVEDPKSDSDVLRPVSSDVIIDAVLSASPTILETKVQGGQVGFEALIAEPIPAIELATEPDEAAGVAVLHNFIKTLEGGPTKYDADVDNEDSPFLLEDNTDAENELDMRVYKNQDPLSPDHVSLHLPKCQGCSGCD